MKIFFLIHSLGAGGAERVTTNLANHWAELGHDITIVTFTSSEDDFYNTSNRVKRVSIDGAKKNNNLINSFSHNINNILKIRRLLKKNRPEIAISMMTTSNVYLAITSIGLKNLRTIGSERNHPPKRNTKEIWSFLRKYSYGRLDVVVALTSQTKEWIESNTKSRNVQVIPNSITYPLLSFEPIVVPPRRKKRYILLAVGRLVEEKDYKTLINVFSSLSEKIEDWDLHILGDGPLMKELSNYVVDIKQSSRVFFHGSVGNVADWYETADLYILTSKTEGFPNSLAEAISYGVPAISFDCETGPRDIIDNNINGILIEDGNIEQLTLKLERLMSDEKLRNKLSKNALSIRERLALSFISDSWLTLFERSSL